MTALRHRNLLVCSPRMPQPEGEGPARRLFHFVDFLRAAGCGVTVCAGHDEQHEEQVERLVRAECFDWALLANWGAAEPLVKRLRAASPATKIVVDAGGIHFLRHAVQSRRPLDVYAAADAVLAASLQEAGVIAALIGDRHRVFVVPDSEDLVVSPFPLGRRRGMFFRGDFAHEPNVEAIAFLCDEILPHVDPAVLADNPIYVAGRNMTDETRVLAADWPMVRMVGWVHSFEPYLQRVRVSLFPLLHGAAATRRMIRTLAIGTPAVTTSVGCAGFPLVDEREVIMADDPVRFAAGITRLLTDEPLWNNLARAGREAIRGQHSHDAARRALHDALVAIHGGQPAAPKPARKRMRMSNRDYDAAIRHAREAIVRGTPPGATVAVVSRGDELLVNIDGRTGWHFPRGDDGSYAGCYPATGNEAVEQLEAVRARGADFFAIPAPSAWWLGYYGDLRTHLEAHYRVIDADAVDCVLVSLREPPAGPQSLEAIAAQAGVAAEPSVDATPVTIVFEGLAGRHTVTRPAAGPPPAISVVIPTRNRAALLAESLDSLARQTANPAVFEVVVVSDGSTDGTADVCRDRAGRLRITHVESPREGSAVAKNLGVDAAAAPLVLFLADDDVADPGLVAAHLAAHHRYPLEQVAVVGFTAWHPLLPVTEVMRFIAVEGHPLFGPAPLHDGQVLDPTAFRGGGASCKRSLLVRAGGFRREFIDGGEYIEASFRIGRMLARERPTAGIGLTVVACRDAVQHMVRPITFDECCRRCEQLGRSRWQLSRVADDRRLAAWCGAENAHHTWPGVRDALAMKVARVHEIELLIEAAGPDRRELLKELHAAYRWTFDAFTLKGLVEAADCRSQAGRLGCHEFGSSGRRDDP